MKDACIHTEKNKSLVCIAVQAFFPPSYGTIMIITWRIIYFKASCSNTIVKKIGIMFCSNQNYQGHNGGKKYNNLLQFSSIMLKLLIFLYWKMFSRNVLLYFLNITLLKLYFKYFWIHELQHWIASFFFCIKKT